MSDLLGTTSLVPSASPRSSGHRRPSREQSWVREVTNARLTSPVPVALPGLERSSPTDEGDTDHIVVGSLGPLAGTNKKNKAGPGESELSKALGHSIGRTAKPEKQNMLGTDTAGLTGASAGLLHTHGNYGSFEPVTTLRSGWQSPKPYEDFEVVGRHLAGLPATGELPSGTSWVRDKAKHRLPASPASFSQEDEFSSLSMQGGDTTREIYRRTEAEIRTKPQRSQSLHVPRIEPEDESLDIENMRKPGGFRRHHLIRTTQGPDVSRNGPLGVTLSAGVPHQPFLTRNFFEFLSLYGHFAGEEVAEDDEDSEHGEEASAGYVPEEYSRDEEDGQSDGETRSLLRRAHTKRRRKGDSKLKMSIMGSVLQLLKSFIGTGVLFLPRAFLNGGMLFSVLILLAIASLSYYCFILLTTSRMALKGSFAEMGEMTYGKWMRALINISLVLSQVGFASAYIVFTGENLQAFVLAVTQCKIKINILYIILMQLVVFLPLSLYRRLSSRSMQNSILVADGLIVVGIIYLWYYEIATLASDGLGDVALFNPDRWTLFIGTAIFTFEGIGLIIPIQDGMEKPQKLPGVLGGVMIAITTIFLTSGALAYAAWGSRTETVIILNMNQENKFVNSVQFIYSVAILLSTPLQIFPAITIMENGLFLRSGRHDPGVKWRKNIFRFIVVLVCAGIAWLGANDLDKFVAIVGSFACIPLVYIYPPLIHLEAIAKQRWTKGLDIGLIIFGIVLMVYTTALTAATWMQEGQEKHPGYCDRF